MYRKNTAGQFFAFQGVDATAGGIKSGVTWTIRRCIDGTFAAATGTATEDGTTGWYKFAMSQADTNGNDIQFNFTGTGAVPQTVNIITTAADPTDSVRLGLTALPNAAASAVGGLPVAVDTSGRVDVLKVNGTSQTAVDLGARLGAPAGASMSADIAAVKADTAAVKVQTDKLTFTVPNQIDSNVIDWKGAAAPAMTGDAFARLGAPAGASVSADIAGAKTDTAAIKVQTDKFVFSVANQVDSNVIDWKGSAAPAMTGDAFARLGAPAGASVSADMAAVKADTGTILTDVNTGAGAIYTRLGAPAGASLAADIASVKSDSSTILGDIPANFSLLSISAAGSVKIQSGIKKNTALAHFEFLMTDSTNHAPITGQTVAVARSIDNGAFGAGALSAVTEIGSGIYSVDFAAGDLNGGVITLMATATGCDARFVTFVTEP